MYKRQILKNNLRLLTAPLPGTEAVTITMYIKVGSRQETLRQSGLAHFIEHLLFKGTTRRPSTLQLSRELDVLGAEYNAFTSKDHTGFYIKVDSQHLESALDIMSDMLFHSVLLPEEITREKGVILEEINMYQDTPMYLSDDLFEENIYHGQSLAHMILGSQKSIRAMTRKQIIDFYKQYYFLSNMILSIGGKLPANTAELVSRYFKSSDKKNTLTLKKIQKVVPKSKINIKYKDTEQIHLVYGLPLMIGYNYNKQYHLKLANVIFGGSMSSRLFINIREKQGLGYYINSSLNAYEDCGSWQVAAGVDKSRLPLAVELINKEWLKLKKGVTASELKQAKAYVQGKMTLRLEDSAEVAQWYGRQELFMDKTLSPEQVKKEIEAVKLGDLNKILNSLIMPNNLVLSVIGPYKNKSELNLKI